MLTDLIRKLWNGRPETLGRALEMRPAGVSRRHFLQAAGITTTVVAMSGTASALWLPKKELVLEGATGVMGCGPCPSGALGVSGDVGIGAAMAGNDGMLAIGLNPEGQIRVSHWFIDRDGKLKRAVEMVADIEKAIDAIGKKSEEIGKRPKYATLVSDLEGPQVDELFRKNEWGKRLDNLPCDVVVTTENGIKPTGLFAHGEQRPMEAYMEAAGLLTAGMEHYHETGRISSDRPNFEEVDKQS